MNMFGAYFGELFELMDIMFILLAIITAWKIPVQLAQQATEAEEEALAIDEVKLADSEKEIN